jgi:hypothetical protein
MEIYKKLKHTLLCAIEDEINEGICEVDTDELGKVIDMLKDIEKAMYYCTVVEAMHHECNVPEDAAPDTKYGRSAHSRRAYLEAKEMHHDKAT